MSINKPGKNGLILFNSPFVVLTAIAIVVITVLLISHLPGSSSTLTSTSPVKEDKSFTVIIDAGHGGRDEGTKVKGAKEKDITLAIAKMVDSLAPQYGVSVVLTRRADTFMNPVARVNFARQQNADAFVSIHVNELRGYSYVSGMQVYVSGKNPDFSQSQLLGSAVAQNLGADFKISHTLQQRVENIYVLADNFMPSVLIECGFITNPADLKILTDPAKKEAIARQILAGIAAYANHQSINEYAVQQVPSSTFRHKAIAVSVANRAKKAHLKKSKLA